MKSRNGACEPSARSYGAFTSAGVFTNMMCIEYMIYRILFFFFFFQAEDGIRDIGVTGVQTCALPICQVGVEPFVPPVVEGEHVVLGGLDQELALEVAELIWHLCGQVAGLGPVGGERSEERRVGKECRSRWSPYH